MIRLDKVLLGLFNKITITIYFYFFFAFKLYPEILPSIEISPDHNTKQICEDTDNDTKETHHHQVSSSRNIRLG